MMHPTAELLLRSATSDDADDADGPDETPDSPEPTPIGPGRPRAGARRGGPGGRGPRRPVGGPQDGADEGSGNGRRITLIVIAVVIALIFALGGTVITFATDVIWYRSVGYESVFWTRTLTQLGLFGGTLVIALIVLLGGLWFADRGMPRPSEQTGSAFGSLFDRLAQAARDAEERSRYEQTRIRRMRGGYPGPFEDADDDGPRPPRRPGNGGGGAIFDTDEMPDLTPVVRIGLIVLAVLISIGVAASVSGNWETIQLWIHRVPYAPDGSTAVVDPIFGRDVSFYLFELPFLRLVQSVATGLLAAGFVIGAARYLAGMLNGAVELTTRIRVHLATIVGGLLLVIAIGYQLDKLELVYSNRGVVTGVSYTDYHAQFIAYDGLTIITALVAAFLIGAAFTRWVSPLVLAMVAWLAASFLLGSIYPAIIQQLTVVPNQFAQEEPYIVNNIAMTRIAFGLQNWIPKAFAGDQPLTAAAVKQESATFQNARIWDYRPLGDTLDQLQTIRQYYSFTDIDTDRYIINGALRQVMLGARELAPEKNTQADSWVNQRITFTHGIGLAMVPVNEATSAGLPDLIVRDLPPVSTTGAPPITEPRIYFGERPSDYVIVDAKQAAFDYPVGSDTNADGSNPAPAWKGNTGIHLDTTVARLLFALRFGDLNLLISDQVTTDSQLLFHRSLSDRLNLIAPFLRYDKDPYMVVTNGRLVYIQDAYTISDRFPNAQPFDTSALGAKSGLASDDFNYIRNSVKIVQDAYDGSLTFYVADPTDPIIRAYEGVFPGVFHPLSEMSADLQAHLRTPEELFNVQTRTYARYHMTNTSVFYSSNDLWTVPPDPGGTQSLPTEAYYVVMRLPDAPNPEFLLLQPMVPNRRPNMIAWVAARNDGADRGTEIVYQFPQDTSVLGPNQIEAKIDADPTISAQVSLWDQSGSKVIKGNLIVIPLQDSLIYLQPIYLQSANSTFPQLQKVVLASGSTVVWGNTLADSLNLLLSQVGPGPSPSPTPTPSPTPGQTTGPTPTPSGPTPSLPAGVAGLIAYANQHFELAQAALRAGDFATYGREIANVQQALSQLQQLVGGSPLPSLGPSPSGSPGASQQP